MASGIPACAGNCSTGDPVNVYAVGSGSAYARCGGTAAVVVCLVGVQLA